MPHVKMHALGSSWPQIGCAHVKGRKAPPAACGWVAGYRRYDTEAERLLLDRICVLRSLLTNYFGPQRELVSKVRDEAEVTRTFDTAATPCQVVRRHVLRVAAARRCRPPPGRSGWTASRRCRTGVAAVPPGAGGKGPRYCS